MSENTHDSYTNPSPKEGNPLEPTSQQINETSVSSPEAVVSAEVSAQAQRQPALYIENLAKTYKDKVAVDGVNLTIPRGSFYGLVGRNGAGKTTTLSMATGMLRPTAGEVFIDGINVWQNPLDAKSKMGVLPDGVYLFDKLTGEQLITYAGLLHSLDKDTVAQRTGDLLTALDLQEAAGRRVSDYSAGMTKKVALAAAMIHAPSLLVLDEPFEAVDPVSASNIQDILRAYVADGGTVILSSHVMDLVQRLCDHVAIMSDGRILAEGTTDQVREGSSLEDRFVELVGGRKTSEGISWLKSS